MKNTIAICLAFFSMTCSAAVIPVCTDSGPRPCRVSVKKENASLIRMMFLNKEGMNLVQKSGQFGLQVDQSRTNPVKITITKESDRDGLYSKTEVYDITLIDDIGIDTVGYNYHWKVTATTEGDEFGSMTTYKNSLKEMSR